MSNYKIISAGKAQGRNWRMKKKDKVTAEDVRKWRESFGLDDRFIELVTDVLTGKIAIEHAREIASTWGLTDLFNLFEEAKNERQQRPPT